MKKEVRLKIEKLEQEEINAIKRNSGSNLSNPAQLLKIKQEIVDYLNSLIHVDRSKDVVYQTDIDNRINNLAIKINNYAHDEVALENMINKPEDIHRKNYVTIIDEKSEILALKQTEIFYEINKLIKEDKKFNKKSFLNVIKCKFKRAKSLENESKDKSFEK